MFVSVWNVLVVVVVWLCVVVIGYSLKADKDKTTGRCNGDGYAESKTETRGQGLYSHHLAPRLETSSQPS